MKRLCFRRWTAWMMTGLLLVLFGCSAPKQAETSASEFENSYSSEMPTTVPETAARTETETGEETGKSTEEQADSEESVSETEDLSTLSEEELQKEQARKDEEARMEVVRQLMKEMTLREKIGQLLMPALRVYQYENGSYSSELLSSEQRAAISELKLGGLILFEESLRTVEGTKKLSRDLQEANALGGAASGLLLATDQEAAM